MIVNLLISCSLASKPVSKQLYKSTAVVSVMTLISRIVGFVRDMLIANLFGVSEATDAFFVAFRIPNFLRRLFAEGAFAHAFVPVLSQYKQHESDKTLKTFIDRTAGTLALILVGVTVLGVIVSPWFIVAFAPGFQTNSDQYRLAVDMLKITFPYVFFISMTALAGSILNVSGRFAMPAITPLVLNLVMIATGLWLAPLCVEPIVALAWGVMLAGVLQLAIQVPALMRVGLWPRLRWGWLDSGVRRVVGLMLPAIFSVSVVQVNMLFDTLMASFLEQGSVSWLYYSDRLVEFPIGMLGAAVGAVILPNLSRSHAANDERAFSASLDWGLRLVLTLGVPATIGLVMLSDPLLSTLFQYNAFDANDVLMSGRSLRTFAIGLLAFVMIKVIVPGFTARQDTRTPVRFGLYSVVSNIVLNVVLIGPLAHAGIALATTLSAYLNAALLLVALIKQKIYRFGNGLSLFIARLTMANVSMVMFIHLAIDGTEWVSVNGMSRSTQLSLTIVGAVMVYALTLFLVGLRPRHLLAGHY